MNLKEIKNHLKTMFLAIVCFFIICVLVDFRIIGTNILFNNYIDFSYVRSKISFYLGSILNTKTSFVSSEKIKYRSIKPYLDGYELSVDEHYVIRTINNGVVIFIGNIEGVGNTVIINCDDGTNISYGNIENLSVNLYDYIPKSTIIGSAKDKRLYLSFKKGKEYQSYENYL